VPFSCSAHLNAPYLCVAVTIWLVLSRLGQIYVFQKGNAAHHWTQNAILRPTDTGEYGAALGTSMAMHENMAVVNAPGAATGFANTREGIT
jgi:hypothetical protein